MEFEAPEDLGSNNYLEVEGQYHVVVTEVRDHCKGSGGAVAPGVSFDYEVVEGEQKGKQGSVSLYNGDVSHKDGGEFARKKQAAFFVASNIMSPDDLGKRVRIDEKLAKGAQICLDLERKKKQDGTFDKYLEPRFTNIFHVDDPRASKVAKSKEFLDMIPTEYRRSPEFFGKLTKNTSKPKDNPPSTNIDDVLF